MTSSFTEISVSSDQLQQAADRLAAKFDLDPAQINIVAWLESLIESTLSEADDQVQFVSELKPFLHPRRVAA